MQEWGDDTHPEIGHAVLRQLAAKGVNVHKAMATRSPPTRMLPPLPGWPVAGTPGCLLMALVSAATHTGAHSLTSMQELWFRAAIQSK